MHLNRFHPAVILASALVAALAGCSPDGPVPEAGEVLRPAVKTEPATAVTFACASGREITVSYPDTASIRLTYLGQDHTLAQIPAAAGARYSGADLDWTMSVSNHQEMAVLSRVGPGGAPPPAVLERCARPVRAPQVVPVEAVPRPADQPAAPRCRGPQLQLEEAGRDAGPGNRVAIVGVRNLGTAACSLTGYPAIGLVDDRNEPLATVRTEATSGSDLRNGQAPSPVTLAASGGQAWFDVAWTVGPHEAGREIACPAAARIRMTAPNDTSPVWLNHRLTPCGGLIRVTPFRAVAAPVPPPS